jgi:hypothetical protein
MKKPVIFTGFVALLASLCAFSAQARHDTYILPIQDVFETSEAKAKLDGHVKFYFADQPHPDVEATLKPAFVIHKKARAYRSDWSDDQSKDDESGCIRSMLVVLRIFQAHAIKAGGNAVINIESYFKKNVFRSNDQFECHAGDSGSGVILRGDIVKLKE